MLGELCLIRMVARTPSSVCVGGMRMSPPQTRTTRRRDVSVADRLSDGSTPKATPPPLPRESNSKGTARTPTEPGQARTGHPAEP